MSLFRRQFFFRVCRFEVFAEGWQYLTGEPLVQTERTTTGVSEEFQLWMPGVHLIVSRRCSAVAA